jgi:hypothetical protein
MIWATQRNTELGQLVARFYEPAEGVPCERQAMMIGGLPGADKPSALARAGVDPSRYVTVSVNAELLEMAARGLIPRVDGLSPLEAADLAHGEAQFLVKRIAMRALADGPNLLFDISMASVHAVEPWLDRLKLAGYATRGIFAEISIEEAVRRSAAEYRLGQEEYRNGRGFGGRYVPPEAIRALANAAGSPEAWTAPASSDGGSGGLLGVAATGGAADMIASYLSGQLTLEDLASEFRAQRWRAAPQATPPGLEKAAPAIDDPEPYVPGSFDDVVLAYDLGQLCDADYEALARAATG